jgi:hypothetical protein
MDARCGTEIPVVRRVWRQTGRRGAPPEEKSQNRVSAAARSAAGQKNHNIVFLWRREAPPGK